jgi:hypothetical protein
MGEKRLRNLLRARRKRHLDLPYGPAAERLGLIRAGPAPPLETDEALAESA